MRVVFVYAGPRDSDLERSVRGFLDARCGPVTALDSHSGEDGMTTATAELADPADEPGAAGHERVAAAVEQLRARPDILDAAAGSLGEGA